MFFTFQFCVLKSSTLYLFRGSFCNFFNGFEIFATFWFFRPMLNFSVKILWGSSQHFALKPKGSQNGSKNRNEVFYKCFLEFNFASVSRNGTPNFLKKVKIFVPQLAITVLSLAHAQARNKFLRRSEVIVSACHFLAYIPS